MKKFLLLILGMLAAIPSLHAYTAADFTNKAVALIFNGAETYNGGIYSTQCCQFEQGTSSNKLILKDVNFGDDYFYDLKFTISGSTLVLDYDDTKYFQSLTSTEGENHAAQVRAFYHYSAMYSNKAVNIYAPSQANYAPNVTFTISSMQDGSLFLTFGEGGSNQNANHYFGYVPDLTGAHMERNVFLNLVAMRVYETNATHAITEHGASAPTEHRCKVVFDDPNAGHNMIIYNWNNEGYIASPDEGDLPYIYADYNVNNKTITIPVQPIMHTTEANLHFAGVLNAGSNPAGYGYYASTGNIIYENADGEAAPMDSQDANLNKSPLDHTWYVCNFSDPDDVDTDIAISGSFTTSPRHTEAQQPINLWQSDKGGNLVTKIWMTATFPNWYLKDDYDADYYYYYSYRTQYKYYGNFHFSDSYYGGHPSVLNAPMSRFTLALENNMAQCGVSAPTDKYPVYVAGNLHLTENAQFFDHAELYLVSGRTTSVADRTDLNTDTGINGALNITAHKHSWNMVACGILSQAELDALGLTAEAWDTYAENNLMRNYNGYIYYNQLVPKADLAAANMLPPAQPAQAPGVRRQMESQEFPYSVFAKVYYTAASGLQPTFHGLTTRWTTTGIDDASVAPMNPATEVGHYDLQGRRIEADAPGVHIIRMSDGTARKSVVK